MTTKLFFSYSHTDKELRDQLEVHLTALKHQGQIETWHDRRIPPGDNFEDVISEELEDAKIILLSISPDFIASDYCYGVETTRALERHEANEARVIPVILRPCDWKNLPFGKLVALPADSKPITRWPDRDEAFLDVVEGIKKALTEVGPVKSGRPVELRKTIPQAIRSAIAQSSPHLSVEDVKFSLRTEFKNKLTEIEFVSQNKENIRIDDIFVFPNIVHGIDIKSIKVKNVKNLWDTANFLILQGEDRSGKTTICNKLFLDCSSTNTPVIMISGQDITSRSRHEQLIERKFKEQFHGQYEEWKSQENKTLIIDDFDDRSRLQFLDFAKIYFSRIFIAVSQDKYIAYFHDEKRLANYELLSICHLSHAQQEVLIRRWRSLNNYGSGRIAHGDIDRLEDRLNSIIHKNKIVPRYPFYVLSILQTYEGPMPQSIQITAYGHCYHALIVAQLSRCGIEGEDIDSALNFLTMLAFEVFNYEKNDKHKDIEHIVEDYRKDFVIKEGVLRRIIDNMITIKDIRYKFCYSFAYYFFLGRFFALNYNQYKEAIERLAEDSYLRDNKYILIFTIHHTYQDDLINTILSHTSSTMENVPVAKLSAEELAPLVSALDEIPKKIISRRSQAAERTAERERRDVVEQAGLDEHDKPSEYEELNSAYRSLKNMEILGQILRNKYGSFPKEKLREIVKTVADAGLRLVRFVTDEDSIEDWEDYLSERINETKPEKNMDRIKSQLERRVRALCFFVMSVLIRNIVVSIRKPELEEVVKEVCQEVDTPAYDLIGFFFVLETAIELRKKDVESMEALVKKLDRNRNNMAERLLSITTQDYLNKHSLNYSLRQRIYKQLRIDYRPNPTKAELGRGRIRNR